MAILFQVACCSRKSLGTLGRSIYLATKLLSLKFASIESLWNDRADDRCYPIAILNQLEMECGSTVNPGVESLTVDYLVESIRGFLCCW